MDNNQDPRETFRNNYRNFKKGQHDDATEDTGSAFFKICLLLILFQAAIAVGAAVANIILNPV